MRNDNVYTIGDIYALLDGERAELIDGKIYYMAPPNRIHQRLLLSLSRTIADYIDSKNGNCEINIAPFAVFLNKDNINYVESDISVVCDPSKLDDKGCYGAPEVYFFEKESVEEYSFGTDIPVGIYEKFYIKVE